MDGLAEAADAARRTLYNQFARKEDIFREALLKMSRQLKDAFPTGIETQGDVEAVLRVIARRDSISTRFLTISGFSVWWWPMSPLPMDRRGIRGRHRPSDGATYSGNHPFERRGHLGLPRPRWRLSSSWGCSTPSHCGRV